MVNFDMNKFLAGLAKLVGDVVAASATTTTPKGKVPTPVGCDPLAFKSDKGPARMPHPYTIEIGATMKPNVAMTDIQRKAMMFEAARKQLTYREIALVFGNTYTPEYINRLAIQHGIIRHTGPTIHVGKTFGASFAA